MLVVRVLQLLLELIHEARVLLVLVIKLVHLLLKHGQVRGDSATRACHTVGAEHGGQLALDRLKLAHHAIVDVAKLNQITLELAILLLLKGQRLLVGNQVFDALCDLLDADVKTQRKGDLGRHSHQIFA